MGIRETINRNPKLATSVVVGLALCGAVVIAIELRSNDGKPPAKNYFTSDDGKTWFADSSNKLPPFDHNGAQAVRCYMFKGPNGKFAGLLEKYSDATRAFLANKTDNKPVGELPVLVKKPGEKEWKSMDATQEAMSLIDISGPDGSGTERIMP